MTVLDLIGPYRGSCGLCGGPDARHRTADAIAERFKAGEHPVAIAADYDLDLNTVLRLAAASEPNPASFPRVQGRCPACRGPSLFLGADGYVTCSRSDCPDPCSPSEVLGA